MIHFLLCLCLDDLEVPSEINSRKCHVFDGLIVTGECKKKKTNVSDSKKETKSVQSVAIAAACSAFLNKE